MACWSPLWNAKQSNFNRLELHCSNYISGINKKYWKTISHANCMLWIQLCSRTSFLSLCYSCLFIVSYLYLIVLHFLKCVILLRLLAYMNSMYIIANLLGWVVCRLSLDFLDLIARKVGSFLLVTVNKVQLLTWTSYPFW